MDATSLNLSRSTVTETEAVLRAPAVPLVTHTPFFSAWSPCDQLTEGWSQHWTESNNPICGLLRIDGSTYRFSGREQWDVPAMRQISVRVHATRTEYVFEAAGIRLKAEFLS
ncbi:MAG TPA: DUF4964 domain-containing protein, partial [Fimbriimonas sp.]